jgi:hypothetical protein
VGFKLSNDPHFEEKLVDIVALYLDPPDHAIVLSVDEKTQIQALDRSQPGLPMKKGRCGTMTHDYKRNGTTTLFAALNTLDGTVISETMERHRHEEWLKFLKRLDRETPKRLALHIICDNYATHKHPAVTEWLEKHKRIQIHFTPTSSSWLNMVENFEPQDPCCQSASNPPSFLSGRRSGAQGLPPRPSAHASVECPPAWRERSIVYPCPTGL